MNNDYKETFNTWNKIASLYKDIFMDFDLYNDTYDVFCELIGRFKIPTILEVGCGSGNISKYIFSKNSSVKLKGIDISENMIALAKELVPEGDFETLDARNILELNSKFDALLCGFTIPYLQKEDLVLFLENCGKILNNDGLLYLSFVDASYAESGFQTNSKGDRMYFYYYPLTFIEAQLKNKGFKVKNSFVKEYQKNDDVTEFHTILIAEKTDRDQAD